MVFNLAFNACHLILAVYNGLSNLNILSIYCNKFYINVWNLSLPKKCSSSFTCMEEVKAIQRLAIRKFL